MAPTLFLVDLYWSVEPITNKTVLLYIYSTFYTSRFDSINQYFFMAFPNLLLTFTLCLTIVCSIVIGYKITLRRNSTLIQLSSSVSKQFKEVKVLKMLLTVCVVNCWVSLPTVIIDLFLLYSDTVKLVSNNFFNLLRSSYINLCQLNAIINFIIYVFMSSKFASTLNQVFLYFNKKRKK
ncbi:thyrotropin-releasing hormone receptor [Biomphalaria pfeifferi]|uniref:Thyrotropin-releasing hormone receptor n=1 Tax=Biomphalaria pfeifferi TaxID=112525 RepID=A0AAD8B383_BIOPF|nr:thyrotropin-releasing hormone receptor [Biomphalaria pfeifferi]